MAVYAKKLYVQKTGSSSVACNIYSTTTEAGSTYLPVNVSGVGNGYVPLEGFSKSDLDNGYTEINSEQYLGFRLKPSANGTLYSNKIYAIPKTALPSGTFLIWDSAGRSFPISYSSTGYYNFTIPNGCTKIKFIFQLLNGNTVKQTYSVIGTINAGDSCSMESFYTSKSTAASSKKNGGCTFRDYSGPSNINFDITSTNTSYLFNKFKIYMEWGTSINSSTSVASFISMSTRSIKIQNGTVTVS